MTAVTGSVGMESKQNWRQLMEYKSYCNEPELTFKSWNFHSLARFVLTGENKQVLHYTFTVNPEFLCRNTSFICINAGIFMSEN